MNDLAWMRGCGTALVTPFEADGRVDEATLTRLVHRQVAAGIALLLPCGTTGEGATLTGEEQIRVISSTVEAAAGRARVVAGVGSNVTADVVARSRSAMAAGADGLLVVAPYYNKPTQSGMIAHFGAVAEAVPEAPIMLYNVPGRTGSNISSATTLHLARSCPNIVAVKEASGDLSQIMTILRDRPEGFRVFAGDDAITLPLVALGADGVVSVAANEAPDLMNGLTEAALSGDFETARSIHYRLLALMDANFIESNPGPVKAVMAHQGLLQEHLRLPLVPVSEATRARLHDVVDAL